MFDELTAAFALLALCVAIHASGMSFVLQWLTGISFPKLRGTWATSWLLIRTAWCLAAFHIVEILLWAGFYRWQNCLPDFKTAVYFSGVTYSSVGYGDVVLPRNWWFLGPMEGLTGILMCGLSTGFFFAVMVKIYTGKSNPGEAAGAGGK
jgi:hypothetical protein